MNSSQPSGTASPQVDRSVPPLFRETQYFFRNWIFLIPVVAVTIIVWYEFGQQVVLGHPQGEEPIPNALAWALTVVFGFGFPLLALVLRLVTEVRLGELSVRLYPFRRKIVPLETIDQAKVRDYSPIREYGGWGIRFSRNNGRAYNAYGNHGVQLALDNGDLLLIGTQQPDQLLTALRTAGAAPDEPKRPARKKPAPKREDG